jgi:4a-hydroxytetrahydrobiopterin dehydratase
LNSIAFVNGIPRVAQNLNHYPDIDIRFYQVTLTFTMHDAGGITEKDFSVARQCDEVFLRFFMFRSIQITSQTTKV